MKRIKIGLIIVGVVFTVMGYQEWRLADKARPDKQILTCAQLTEKGFGDNANVTVKDAVVLDTWFVYKGTGQNGPWSTIWVPLVPAEGPYIQELRRLYAGESHLPEKLPPPKDIRLILKSGHTADKAAMDRLVHERTFDGMIVNEIEKLEGKEKQLLEQGFPGTDFSQCYILEHGRTPASRTMLLVMLGGGLAAAGLGVFWLWAGRGQAKPITLSVGPVVAPPAAASPPPAPPVVQDDNPYAAHKDDR